MNRKEAESLVGKRVHVWTAANGEYVGVLVTVKPCRPWRGLVRITGVLSTATPWEAGRRFQRKGFRPGQEIEAGNSSIKATDMEGWSYLHCLKAQLSKLEDWQKNPNPKDLWWLEPSIKSLKEQIAAEECV